VGIAPQHPNPHNEVIIIAESTHLDSFPMLGWIATQTSIVIVEDPMVGRLIHSVLARLGYPITEASSATALDLFQGKAYPGLIVTNKPQLFLDFADHTRLLYVAAVPDYRLAEKFPMSRVLLKPFHPTELLNAVERLLTLA
jgi:CheY-like chemotaxis protein